MRLVTLAMIGLTSSAALAAGDPPFRIDFTPVGFYDKIPATDVAYARAFDELCLTTQFYFDFAKVNPDGTINYVQRVNTNFLESLESVAISSDVIIGKAFEHVVALSFVGKNGPQGPGEMWLMGNVSYNIYHVYPTGPLPVMIGFSPNGRYIVSANAGEPNDDFTDDPVGGVTIVDRAFGPVVETFDFESLDPAVVGEGIIMSSPKGTSLAEALEPQCVAFSSDSTTGYVVCQENNALAKFDLASGTWEWVRSLGFKDHSLPGNELDASDLDGEINIANWPIYGAYMPDEIAVFNIDGVDYIATANEGAGRDYGGYSNVKRVNEVNLDPVAFPDAKWLQQDRNLGRINIDSSIGDVDGDGDYDVLYSFGARSMSIFDTEGVLVADTGAIMEQVTADLFPNDFNSTNDQNDSFDNRSDDKGPEPEGLAIGKIGERTLVFVGLERIGGVMAFDVSDPTAPAYAGYVNTRDFNGIPPLNAGDLDPAGLEFIPAEYSPNDSPMLAVAFGESQVTRLFQIDIAIACLGDVNLSGGVDAADIGLLLANWGVCSGEG